MTGLQYWLQGYLHMSEYRMGQVGILLMYEIALLVELMPWRKRQRQRHLLERGRGT